MENKNWVRKHLFNLIFVFSAGMAFFTPHIEALNLAGLTHARLASYGVIAALSLKGAYELWEFGHKMHDHYLFRSPEQYRTLLGQVKTPPKAEQLAGNALKNIDFLPEKVVVTQSKSLPQGTYFKVKKQGAITTVCFDAKFAQEIESEPEDKALITQVEIALAAELLDYKNKKHETSFITQAVVVAGSTAAMFHPKLKMLQNKMLSINTFKDLCKTTALLLGFKTISFECSNRINQQVTHQQKESHVQQLALYYQDPGLQKYNNQRALALKKKAHHGN